MTTLTTLTDPRCERLLAYLATLERSLSVCRERQMYTTARSYERQITETRRALRTLYGWED
jgi:hypothetical protein